MGKLLLILSVIILLLLGIGTATYPDYALFWLASGSQLIQIVRGVLIVLLLAQVFTNPPRKVWFRWASGLAAIAICAWTIQATYNFAMPVMDMFVFLLASNALLVTALERSAALTMNLDLTEQRRV